MTSNLRILCISPFFPPMADSEGFCSAKMVMELMRLGCDVTVLRMDVSMTNRQLDQSSVWQPAIKASLAIKPTKSFGRISSVFYAIRYRTDSYARWIGAVVAEARSLHRKKRFDLVYSRSLPMIAHIAGYWCAKAIRTPWVANINDPWDLHLCPGSERKPHSWTHIAISEYWLRMAFMSETLVTYPSSRLCDFHTRFASVAHKSAIVTHIGYASSILPEPSQFFHLVHTGLIAQRISGRSPSGLISGLDQFLSRNDEARSKVRLTLVGPEDAESKELVAKLGLQTIVTWTGRVSYEESLKYIKNASVCVLVEGNMAEGIYLPSKLADYIVAQKPILALSPANGVIADMLPCRGILRVSPDNVNGIAKAFERLYRAHQQGKLYSECSPDEIVLQFTPENVVTNFFSAVSKVVPNISS